MQVLASKSGANPKQKAKAKAKTSTASAASVAIASEGSDVEDQPQEKGDAAFLKATQLKMKSATQVIEHITEAKSLSDIDESRIVAAIRSLDGRLVKIDSCGLINTKLKTLQTLKWLRALGALLKSEKAYLGKCRIVGKQVEASAILQTGFNAFEECKFPENKLPVFIRTALLCFLLSVFISLCSPRLLFKSTVITFE